MKIVLVILLFFLQVLPCWAKTPAKKAVKKGNLLYNKREFSQALKSYEEALLDAPESDIVNYDLGAALYKTEDYQGAIGQFEKSLVSPDPSLEQMASYNIGNAKYKFGIAYEQDDIDKAINLLKESLRHYEHALEIDPEDEDAKYNYDFVKKELERLQKKQQQQQEQQQQQQQQDQQQQQEQQQQQQQQQQDQEQQQQQSEEERRQQQQQQQKAREEQQQAESQSPQQQQQQISAPVEPGQMSEQEAEMILEGYAQEEEPKGLYRQKMPRIDLPHVVKDW